MKPPVRAGLRIAVVALAVAALVPLLGVDPALVALLLDADFLLLAGVVGLTMVGADAKVLASGIARSLPVLWIRVGVTLSRTDPGTLVSPWPNAAGGGWAQPEVGTFRTGCKGGS